MTPGVRSAAKQCHSSVAQTSKRIRYHYPCISLVIIACFYCLFGFSACSFSPPAKQPPVAQDGHLDLQDWHFESEGVVSLNGEWTFYWRQLLEPEDFSDKTAPNKTGTFMVPNTWNHHTIDGEVIPAHGYASFRLLVAVDPEIEILQLKSLEASSAFKLWINGKKKLSSGQVGVDKERSKPRYLSQSAIVQPENGRIELVLQVSNFRYERGGPWNEFQLGTVKQINTLNQKNLITEFFLFGAILIMGFYHLGLFLLRPREQTPLFFGIFCILVALRVVVTGERMAHEYLPWLGWEMLVRLEFITFYLAVPLFLTFLGSLFPEFRRRTIRVILVLCYLFTALVLVTPPIVFSKSLPYFQFLVLAGCPLVLFFFLQTLYHKREGSVIITVGSLIVIATLIYDILESNLYFSGINLAPAGLFVFILIQSFMLSVQFSRALSLSEELSASLEEKVEERTQSLQKANDEIRLSSEKLKEAQSQLIQSQKMEAMGTLAGGIAHEFNNILGTIMGYTGLLKNELPVHSAEKQYAEAIFLSGERAAELVQQILTFSRVDNLELKPLFLQHELREILRMLRVTLPDSITIRETINDDCQPVLANQTQISQIIVNLCTNAAHAMKEGGGLLEVELEQIELKKNQLPAKPEAEGAFLLLTISDTGIGMSTETRERIFDPFFTTKKVGEGSGLGLSIVHGIVSKHHGAINVDSEPGKGTRFFTYLPVTDKMPEIQEEKPKIEVKGFGHILIVEDDQSLAKFYHTVMKKLGYQTTVKNNGKEALECFRNDPERFDLVFSDQIMPHMSGFEMSEKILSIKPDIPIILSTGYNPTITEPDARNLGIKCLLMKPIRISTLAQKLAEFIR